MSLMLCLTKRLSGKGKIVVLYYGLYVLQGLVDIRKKGVYGSVIINKSIYWPHYIDGEKSRLTLPKRVLGPCMNFVVILKISLFMSFL